MCSTGMIRPTFCTIPQPPNPVMKQPETPALPQRENGQPPVMQSESSSAKASENKPPTQTTASDTSKSTCEDRVISTFNPGSSADTVRTEKTNESHTEEDKAGKDSSGTPAQDKDKIVEKSTESEEPIPEDKDPEYPMECEWDSDRVSEAVGSGSNREEEDEREKATEMEDDAADEKQSQENVNKVNSVTNTQPGSTSKVLNSESDCESQNTPEKENNEVLENVSIPSNSHSSPVSLCESSSTCTPEKLSSPVPPFPSQHLYLCTPFTSPQKLDDQSSPTSSSSPLCTPVLTAPSPALSTEALEGLRQRNLTAELETEVPSTSSLVKNMPGGQGHVEVTGKGKATTALRRVTESPIIDRKGALVTSVYEAPVLTKEKGERSLRLINITPSKPERLRKISPAKTFRSPLKTSPLKQVSPILRKYHKYSPKKRHIRSGKLLPILPKLTVSRCDV